MLIDLRECQKRLINYYNITVNNDSSLYILKIIHIYIPVKINEIINKYNSSGNYYNDHCYKITSEKGTDIILNVRRIINNF